MKRKTPPWQFVKGAPAGYRKLRNRLTGKTRLIRMGARRKSKKNPYFVGLKAGHPRETFFSKSIPTQQSHGSKYGAVIGPFKTKRGANFMAAYGGGNPHLQSVSDAELAARNYSKNRARRNPTCHPAMATVRGDKIILPSGFTLTRSEFFKRAAPPTMHPKDLESWEWLKRSFKQNPVSGADQTAAHELVLYGTNDSDLYFKSAQPILSNLAKKIRRGVYQPAAALKLWEYHATRTAQKYAREFADGREWNVIFTAATRRLAAKEFQDNYEEELREKGGKKANPVTSRRLPSGKYRVRSGKRIKARSTTKARAGRQLNLLRAIQHSKWRPTGQPARDVRRKLKRRKISRKVGQELFARRSGRKWTLRTKPAGGSLVAKSLTLNQLRQRARKIGYHIRSL